VIPLRDALRVYPIIDPSVLDGRSCFEHCEALLAGGARIVQLRHKEATTRELYQQALELTRRCDERGARLIVNDRVDVALAAGAHGIHLGPHDLPIIEARKLAPELVIGASAGSARAARAAEAAGADYLGCGAVYDASASKPDASSPRGAGFIGPIVEAVSIPVVGIGGIDAENADQVIRAGAVGVAVIRAVATEHPEAAARALMRAVSAVSQA